MSRGLGKRVPDAIQLHLFARAFEERLIGLPVRESEGGGLGVFLDRQHSDDPRWQEWRHRTCARPDAGKMMEDAIKAGVLPVWSYFTEGPVELDHEALQEINHASLACGVYKPINRSQPLEGVPLWVKKEDGQIFSSAVISELYPETVPGKSTSDLEGKCQRWLEKEFAADTPGTRSDFLEAARRALPRLSGRQFERAWGRAAPKFGRNKPGRPQSSKSPRR